MISLVVMATLFAENADEFFKGFGLCGRQGLHWSGTSGETQCRIPKTRITCGDQPRQCHQLGGRKFQSLSNFVDCPCLRRIVAALDHQDFFEFDIRLFGESFDSESKLPPLPLHQL